MGNEEKIGALVISLLLFSIAASLLPMGLKYKNETKGPLLEPWLTKGGFIARRILSNSISLSIDMGKVDVVSDPSAEEPKITLKGAFPTVENGMVRLIAGQIALSLPKSWNGGLSVKVGMGSITLSNASIGSLKVEMGTGSIEGSINLSEEIRINVDKGSVQLTVYVPEDVKVRIKVRSLDGSIYYDGQRLDVKENELERTFGSGKKTVYLNIGAYSVDLRIVPMRG